MSNKNINKFSLFVKDTYYEVQSWFHSLIPHKETRSVLIGMLKAIMLLLLFSMVDSCNENVVNERAIHLRLNSIEEKQNSTNAEIIDIKEHSIISNSQLLQTLTAHIDTTALFILREEKEADVNTNKKW